MVVFLPPGLVADIRSAYGRAVVPPKGATRVRFRRARKTSDLWGSTSIGRAVVITVYDNGSDVDTSMTVRHELAHLVLHLAGVPDDHDVVRAVAGQAPVPPTDTGLVALVSTAVEALFDRSVQSLRI